ncbi:MAG TPA: hypothetical protein HA257_01145 [Candidatus Methanoperedenaceae archaeon]|nr:hypothetical protein [Candidatus Methanoperedenaceae archaeon]
MNAILLEPRMSFRNAVSMPVRPSDFSTCFMAMDMQGYSLSLADAFISDQSLQETYYFVLPVTIPADAL